ncbi:DciA family protein [Hydrogenophaga sp.]|uniref:DciA family protein n=1 Tax=Hydrogenophaga sp. TaxID=1904254 RepID=UPI00356A9209
MTEQPRRHQMQSVTQALGGAPTLAALQERIRESRHCMDLVEHLIPAALRRHVTPGPIQENEWCLLVRSTAASTKLRQLLPSLRQELTQKGAQVNAIRIKVQTQHR